MTNQLPFKNQFPVFNKSILKGLPVLNVNPKLFDIDNVAAYLTKDSEPISAPSKNVSSKKRFEEQVGPLRLPYEAMWTEFKVRTTKQPIEVGAFLYEFEPSNSTPRRESIELAGIPDLHPDKYAIAIRFFDLENKFSGNGRIYWVTKSGEYVDHAAFADEQASELGKYYLSGPHKSEENYDRVMGAVLAPTLLSIGLTNARNIETEDRTTKPTTKRRHRKRIPVPGTEYKVIKLPGAPSNRVDGEVKNEGATRYHTVRGHFKTYTAEKPLYGKLTGTWWWAPSVRGNKKHGEIISTYEQHTK